MKKLVKHKIEIDFNYPVVHQSGLVILRITSAKFSSAPRSMFSRLGPDDVMITEISESHTSHIHSAELILILICNMNTTYYISNKIS